MDESAIVGIEYEPGSVGGGGAPGGVEAGRYSDDDGTGDGKGTDGSPPRKKRRENGGDGPAARGAGGARQVGRKRLLPPSLTISFDTCAFRVFSLEGGAVETAAAAAEATRPSSRIWGTLSKAAETAEDRLLNARSALVRQFGIDDGGRKRCRGGGASVVSWRMAPPGSGLAFHTWPESLETSSFRSNATREYDTSLGFDGEGWSCCLGGEHGTIECASAASSPQKSSSPSKSGSSGTTNFEHGQKEGPQSKKNGLDNGNSGEHQHDEKDETFRQTSDLSRESKKNDDEQCGVELSPSQTPSLRNKDRESETNNRRHITENGGGKVDTESEGANQQSRTDEIRIKYRLFQLSAAHMELANPAAASSRRPGNVSVATHLTSCAESLASSYMSVEEFGERSRQFENDIGRATSEMETALGKMFPARGRKSNAAPAGRGADLLRTFEELMSSRKEAVAAKLALLMIPKR